MRKLFLLLVLGTALIFGACGGEKIDPVCSADCLGKMRPQAQACGEDQACKQKAMADLKACEATCKK